MNREIQNEETNLIALRGKYKVLASNLNNQQREDAENIINKIEVKTKRFYHNLKQKNVYQIEYIS